MLEWPRLQALLEPTRTGTTVRRLDKPWNVADIRSGGPLDIMCTSMCRTRRSRYASVPSNTNFRTPRGLRAHIRYLRGPGFNFTATHRTLNLRLASLSQQPTLVASTRVLIGARTSDASFIRPGSPAM